MHQKYKLHNYRPLLYLLLFFAASSLLRGAGIAFISNHITNFAITGFVMTLSAFPDLYRRGLSKLSFIGLVSFWTALNIAIEFFVSLKTLQLPGVSLVNFNTPDPIDAVFGILAIALFAGVVLRYGSAKVDSKTRD